MATVSFHRNLVISSEEEAQRMLDAIAEADERGPEQFPDLREKLEGGKEFLKRGLTE
jgi:rubrerythrin